MNFSFASVQPEFNQGVLRNLLSYSSKRILSSPSLVAGEVGAAPRRSLALSTPRKGNHRDPSHPCAPLLSATYSMPAACPCCPAMPLTAARCGCASIRAAGWLSSLPPELRTDILCLAFAIVVLELERALCGFLRDCLR